MLAVSYCTTCHNRLWQLEQTIAHNLAFTKSGEAELCVLAYNDDSVEPYLAKNFSEHLSDGRLKVLSHTDEKPFSFGYVKTLAHQMGSGRVLFNLDADNYIDGVEDVLPTLTDFEVCVVNIPSKDGRCGRVGVTRNTFNLLNGYLNVQHFADDGDFVVRAMRLGRRLRYARCDIAPISNMQN